MTLASYDESLPRVLIVGGGFAGLEVAKALRGAPANVAILDRANHHVFQPLLYQVATASLSSESIAAPVRATLRGRADCGVVLVDVKGIDPDAREVLVDAGRARYDYLVLAAGVRHHYFGHPEWEDRAPGLKSLADAREIRRRMLLAFESAEHEADEAARRAALTFVIVGGGPTGVELAGAIKSIASKTLPREYVNIDTSTSRVVLLEGGPRVLASFPAELSARARRDLEELGVDVRVNTRVTHVSDEGVEADEERIAAASVFWAAGVKASSLGADLGVELDRAGRVPVNADLSVPGRPEVFVVGDMATYTPAGAERPLPGVAQTALQMGRHVGETIRRELAGEARETARRTFVYRDKGSMAIIGKNRAVAAVGTRRFTGFVAWLIWAFVHVAFLVGFRNRLRVMLSWSFSWLLNSHDARVIVDDARLEVTRPHGPGFTPTEAAEASADAAAP
ncbi:MAG: NAD(P)/FAD-dependent oxidoreductase [Myxococcota bacterium]